MFQEWVAGSGQNTQPIMNDDCRNIFIKWIKDTGREFILGDINNE
jgi:hypothetical protein